MPTECKECAEYLLERDEAQAALKAATDTAWALLDYVAHKKGCKFKLSEPAQEGTCTVLVDCTCGLSNLQETAISRHLQLLPLFGLESCTIGVTRI